jgi:hypothetical protein
VQAQDNKEAARERIAELERVRAVKVRAAKAELDKVQADLDKLEADLKKKLAAVQAARAKVALAKLKRDLEARARAAAASRKEGVVIRIEISGLAGKPEELKALVNKLEKVLGGEKRRVLILRTPADGQPRRDGARWTIKPAPPGRVVIPSTGSGGWKVKVATPANKRLDSLEKKLDSVLKELEALRRELKRGGARPPADRPAVRSR